MDAPGTLCLPNLSYRMYSNLRRGRCSIPSAEVLLLATAHQFILTYLSPTIKPDLLPTYAYTGRHGQPTLIARSTNRLINGAPGAPRLTGPCLFVISDDLTAQPFVTHRRLWAAQTTSNDHQPTPQRSPAAREVEQYINQNRLRFVDASQRRTISLAASSGVTRATCHLRHARLRLLLGELRVTLYRNLTRLATLGGLKLLSNSRPTP